MASERCLALFVLALAVAARGEGDTWRPIATAPPELDRLEHGAVVPPTEMAPAADALFQYRFLPQAGIAGRDAFVYNYVDLDPLSGETQIIDWDCSGYTYDGHRGHDIVIRGFREQAIGVPVYAAYAGTVQEAVDWHPDDSIDWTPKPNNVVILDHGNGYRTFYYHIRTGSALVLTGQAVVAGQQIASVASSGISSIPHLHFETRLGTAVVEPSTGPCHNDTSLWAPQEPIARAVYLREAFFAASPFPEIADPEVAWRTILLDQRVRLGSAVKGTQPVYLWLEFYNLPGASSGRLRVFDPKKKLRWESTNSFGLTAFARAAFYDLALDTAFDQIGDWRIVLDVLVGDGEIPVLDSKLRVVPTPKAARNRPPARVKALLGAARAEASRPTICSIATSLVNRDADHDLVSYRYEWRVRGKLVRALHSAALTDLLPAGVAAAKDKVSCRVRPHDGKVFGPWSEARTK